MTHEVLTIAEIEAKYPSEWILVADPKTNDALEVESGTVLFHSADRDEVYRMAAETRPKRSAILNTRAIPQGTAVIL
ncbi:MAG: hypothetical protein AB7G28_06910 [Pirellulales bacterium]